MVRAKWPVWWDWELELSPHLLKRMVDRRFTEVDLRSMLDHASDYRRAGVQGRFIVETRHKRRAWAIVVEPDPETETLVIETAYPVF